MQYQGWNFEKTLLIQCAFPRERKSECIDVQLPVETAFAANLRNDVRVILKKDWNVLEREIPSQVYRIENHGAVTTFRVCFNLDIVADAQARVGIYYDNPHAAPPLYPSPLAVRGSGLGYAVETPVFQVETDPLNGQLKNLTGIVNAPNGSVRRMTWSERTQEGNAVIFAVQAGGAVRGVKATAADWTDAEIVEDVRGPIFMKQTRRGKLVWPGCPRPELCPELEITYKFFAEQPFFLVYSKISFPADTEVFGIYHDLLAARRDQFTHYTFRPVSPDLPATEFEEMGHILVDPELTSDLPAGPAFSGFLPYSLAWQALLNSKKENAWAVSGIQLLDRIATARQAFPFYRSATYPWREEKEIQWFRAPVYVKLRNRKENVITVPADTAIEHLSSICFWPFDQDWGTRTDALGKRLNNPATVSIHPRFLAGAIPRERFEPLPAGTRADAYLRFGVR